MGSWFSNLHVRKTETITNEIVCDYIKNALAEKKYILEESAQDADVIVAVLTEQDSQWISICSQAFAHDDPDSCKAVAAPLSAQLHTDVMGIACFDSDYLYLNLINAEENADAWVGIGAGKELGITRRNNVTAWKKKVSEYPSFSAAAKGAYPCADEFLTAAESCLGLSAEQGSVSLDYLKETSLQQDVMFLYFRQEEQTRSTGPDLRICYMQYAFPCFAGKENSVTFLNIGDEFQGVSVYFLGPYVEQDEITFCDVKMGYLWEPLLDLELKKMQLPDGQWAYGCHIPDILIPAGVRGRMKQEKRYYLERERMRNISFIPQGNPRKMLDITVLIVPDGKPDNQAMWNIWHQHGSKEGFIKHYNKIWKQVRAFEEDPDQCLPFLKIEDFDE